MPEPVISLLFSVCQVLHDLGGTLYAGPMVAFTLLLAMARRGTRVELLALVRTLRAWGAGFGLAMGAWVLGLLALHYLQTGAFRWAWGSAYERWTLVRHLVFLALWVWNVRVEIWSLEPLRRLDRGAEPVEPAALRAASGPLLRDMALQSTLLVSYLVLGAFEPL